MVVTRCLSPFLLYIWATEASLKSCGTLAFSYMDWNRSFSFSWRVSLPFCKCQQVCHLILRLLWMLFASRLSSSQKLRVGQARIYLAGSWSKAVMATSKIVNSLLIKARQCSAHWENMSFFSVCSMVWLDEQTGVVPTDFGLYTVWRLS